MSDQARLSGAPSELKPAPSEFLCDLISRSNDASFECGEWTKDDDETYEEVHARAEETHQALADHVALMEQLLNEAYELMPLDGTKKRADWIVRVAKAGVCRSNSQSSPDAGAKP